MKGFCIALRALWANQTACALLRRRLGEERARAAALAATLEDRDSSGNDMAATVRSCACMGDAALLAYA